MNILLCLSFVLLVIGFFLNQMAVKKTASASVFDGLADALSAHNDALEKVLTDSRVPAADKDTLIRVSHNACVRSSSKKFFEIAESIATSKPDQLSPRLPRYFDGNNELFSRHLAVTLTAINVSSWLTTGSGRDGEKVIALFLSEPIRDEQIIYRFGNETKPSSTIFSPA